MYRSRLIGLLVMACMALMHVQAQRVIADSGVHHIKKTIRSVIAASAGTTGLGLEYRYSTHHKFYVGIETNYLNIERNIIFQLSGEQVTLHPIIKFIQGGIHLSYMPFNRDIKHHEPSFNPRIRTGLFFRNNGNFFFRGTSDAILNIGSFELTPEEIGGLSVYMKTNRILPYGGLGFDLKPSRLIPLSLGIDGGMLYHGVPFLKLSGDGLYSSLQENEKQLNQNMAPFIWYPMVKMSLQYHFKN